MNRRELLAMAAGATIMPIVAGNTDELTGHPPGLADHLRPLLQPAALSVASWAVPIYEATLNPARAARKASLDSGSLLDGNSHPLRHLHQSADRVVRAHLVSDYAKLARLIPVLIGQLELASLQAGINDDMHIQRLLSDVYAVVGWVLIKANSPAAAWVAAQKAVDIASDIEDTFRGAAATRCLSEVHMRAGNLHEASRIAFLAAVHLDRTRSLDRTTAACLKGAALLSASAAASRRGDSYEASTAIRAAACYADDLGQDRSAFGTAFGPVNVAIHRVAISVELGNAREAIGHIPDVDVNRMPTELIERRARFLIDVARAYGLVNDDSAAIAALQDAEKIAPDEVRNHRLTHELLRSLLAREHRASGLRELAGRCKVSN